MNYLVRSVRAVGLVFEIFVGKGFTTPVDNMAREYPSLHYYF